MTPAISPISQPLFITQRFGERPWYYKKYGLAGHNGLDLRAKTGTGFFAMLPGVWELLSERSLKYVRPWNPQGWYGYGAAWQLFFGEANGGQKRFTFAHLQNRRRKYDGQNLPLRLGASPIQMAEGDNTGDSSASHLHITLKQYSHGTLQNYGNGYKGALDPLPYLKDELGFTFTNA